MNESALVVYGIDLGGPAVGWNVRETDPVGLTTDWAADAACEGELRDIVPSLLHLNVKVEKYGDDGIPSWLLVTYSKTINIFNSNEVLDLSSLLQEQQHNCSAWDATLRRALTELGLTPYQPRPRWLVSLFMA
ncbi:hypothetical protein ACGFJT_36970 [Actinomadura geliboluensis]|uniref:hypothetical protein n=1 Tax=Actinomadura geliboluensis TaxID=882440 RepID=UPI00371CA988